MLPWATGHNVAAAQARRAKKEAEEWAVNLTATQFQSWLDKWCESYHNRLHDGLGCTPNERLAWFYTQGWAAAKPKHLEENLRFALLKEDLTTVGKKGIRYNGRNYIAPELAARVGQKLAIRVNEENHNEILVYSDLDPAKAELICVATWDMALSAEEQARIATAKPAIAAAVSNYQEQVKQAAKKLQRAVKANPEKLLPERGGIAAMQATKEVELATARLVQQADTFASQKEAERQAEVERYRKLKEAEELARAEREAKRPKFRGEAEWVALLVERGLELEPVDLTLLANRLVGTVEKPPHNCVRAYLATAAAKERGHTSPSKFRRLAQEALANAAIAQQAAEG